MTGAEARKLERQYEHRLERWKRRAARTARKMKSAKAART